MGSGELGIELLFSLEKRCLGKRCLEYGGLGLGGQAAIEGAKA